MNKNGWIILFSLTFWINTSFANSLLVVENAESIYPIGDKIEVYEDKSNTLTIERLLKGESSKAFSPSVQSIPNFQMTASAVWCRFFIKNETDRDIYLEVGSSFLDSIILYTVTADGAYTSYATGDNFPFHQRDVKTNSFLFKLPLKQGEGKLFYLRVKCNEPLQFPLNVGSLKAFYEFDHQEDFLHGIFYGFMLLMVLYNLMIYLSTREKIYLFYILYVASVTTFISNINGYFFEYFWPTQEWINQFAALSTAFTIFFSLVFTQKFLNTRYHAPKLHKVSKLLLLLPLGISILNFSGLNLQAIMFSQVSLLVVGVYFIAISVVVLRRGYKPARFYLLAWSALVISIIALILKDVNVLPYNVFTINALQIGSGLEVLLLSLAVANKINDYKQEKEEAQQQAVKSLLEKEQFVREQNQELERKVIERTTEISEKNEELNQQNEEIQLQRDALEKAYTHITDSMRYALRIQNAILGDVKYIGSKFEENFILFIPKDIVSGDFYWYAEKNNLKILIAADCTGHGVPGAFMTLIGNDLLTEIIHAGITDPATILYELDSRLVSMVNKQNVDKGNATNDGMDMAVLVFDEENRKVHFSGAKNPLYFIRDGELHQIKGSKFPIGSSQYKVSKEFITETLEILPGDRYYIFSDGYQDQFGGESNAKFLSKRFREVLFSSSSLPLVEQKELLEKTHLEWRTGYKQTDDILVIGVKY